MKVKFSPCFFAMACGVFLLAQGLIAQTTNVQLFSEVNVRNSTAPNYLSLDKFNTTTVNLTCNTSPISASLSGPLMNGGGTAPALDASNNLQAGGNLLVDNVLLVTSTPTSTNVAGPTTNVCTGVSADYYNGPIPTSPVDLRSSCFTTGYQGVAYQINGANPDTGIAPGGTQTIDVVGGVAPIDISALLSPGKQNVEIDMGDGGGILVGSSLFLSTNCVYGGVTGPATISGNPITGDSSTQAQTFNFDTGNNQVIGFTYDVSKVTAPGNGSIPKGGDQPLAASDFQNFFVPGTSFATSNCLIHDGELLADQVTHACKLYTLLCLNPSDGTTTGANCPVSTLENEVVKDVFDGPPFTLPNINTPFGMFREGLGFLMASDDWTAAHGGPCNFDPLADPVATLPCPQNLLDSFSGPGAFSGQGLTTNPNSTFISVYGVPEYNTSVSVKDEEEPHWNKTSTPTVRFSSVAPNFTKGATVRSGSTLIPLPYAANYIPAPIKGITFGITAETDPLPLPINEPISNDITLTPATGCPQTLPITKTEPTFSTSKQIGPLPDGKYIIHYYAQDCAGTQELQFAQDPSGSWSTSFYTHPIAIDTTRPVISGVSLSNTGTIHKNSTLYVNYTCSDATSGSGVVLCGTKKYAHDHTYTTTLQTKLNTSTLGTFTYKVVAEDGADNNAIPQTVTYTVVP